MMDLFFYSTVEGWPIVFAIGEALQVPGMKRQWQI
jgi:hypothetical protein